MSDDLAPLRAKFVARCAEDLRVVLLGAAAPGLPQVIHRLAGVSGIFGFDDMGALAQRLDAQEPGFAKSDLELLSSALKAVTSEAC